MKNAAISFDWRVYGGSVSLMSDKGTIRDHLHAFSDLRQTGHGYIAASGTPLPNEGHISVRVSHHGFDHSGNAAG